MEQEFFASCLAGFEHALADELKEIGIERVRPLGGGVAFFCDPVHAQRACLWSRLASRIMMVVGHVDAADADQLYTSAYAIEWEDILAPGATVAVHAHGTNDQLRNTRFTALKVKDALVDRMREKRDERPQVDTVAPRASIDVRIRNARATISLDFSGEALNHRS
ncbi:MAG: bifunctional 23S rRNA (guanine(2069)-N(7))-methyltransferase RlmK/23S rRNA (guanine(2445)-N(2))-methyltransferase RlmL, partial [Eggerthellaceae bacterium]|nr:bifunctional 23S rRNA (guanine(2069)-N(7))-methyltransferase RlmK/23S rRNA (guanine(2445)-N(2))-methyltransferase RlmL [Eggerthellaceae bacterium]